MDETYDFDKTEYLECKIYKNDDYRIQSLPYRHKIKEVVDKLSSVQIEWDAYYNYNKSFRRFVQKTNLYNQLKYRLEDEFHINCATNKWLNVYEILCRFQDIFCYHSLLTLFNTDMPGEIIMATEHFFKKKRI